MLQRLADLIDRRPRLTLAASLVVTALAFAIGGPIFGLLTSSGDDFQDPASENVEARQTLEEATGATPEVNVIALVEPGTSVRSGEGRARVEEVAETLAADPAVAQVASAFNTGNESFVSREGDSAYVVASFEPVDGKEEREAGERIVAAFEGDADVLLGGPTIANIEIDEQIGEDLARAEMVGIPILLLLSLLFFRGVVAALLPFAAALVSIGTTLFLLRLTHEFVAELSVFSINLVTGLGIGLAIDYSLFMVWRYREELARHGPGREAIARTLATAGRTVAFSALTVAAAMAALFAFPQRFLYSMGFAGVFVALMSAVTAIVFLTALLAVLGPRVNALSPRFLRRSAEETARGEPRGAWYRLSHTVMRWAVPVAVVTTALLITLGVPFFGIKFTGADAGVLPPTASARQVQDTLRADFDQNRTSPIYVAAEAPSSSEAEVEAYAEELGDLPNVLAVVPPRLVGDDTWRIDAFAEDRALSDETQDLVARIRDVPAPFPTSVGGEAPAFYDQQASFRDNLPLALVIVCLTTAILLFLLTGSVVLPLKTLILNVLSLSATLGFLVWVFQQGHLEGLFDFESEGALNSTQPILIGAIAFALSTDYAVFLLTRIKETRDQGTPDTEAVAVGLERTGRIVTAAALMLAVAIGAFVTSEIMLIKQLGLGVAFAVLLDATIVRALLVPSLMKLLGERNWWAPAPLRRLHDRFGLRES